MASGSELFYYKDENVDVHEVFNRIVDEKSKRIFIDRILMSVTNDVKYLKDILELAGSVIHK